MANNILFLIIDQLRADYLQYLPRCQAILPHSVLCENTSIPASTEAMHTNISTGTTPKEHGFISKTTKEGKTGLEDHIGKMLSGELQSIASRAKEYGYGTIAIGGKPETVRVMGTAKQCSLQVYPRADQLIAEGSEADLVKAMASFLAKNKTAGTDVELIDLFEQQVWKSNRLKNYLSILTLPDVDKLGHAFGPHSQQIQEQLGTLDEKISELVKQTNAATILTGDHGCRITTTYVIEADKKDPRKISVYQQNDREYTVVEKYELDKENNMLTAQYDGGILRIWFRDGTGLSENDSDFLSKYGEVHTKESTNEHYENSRHENIGVVVVVADPDTTFCKASWIDKDVYQDKVKQLTTLKVSELPIGEHGTYHKEDTNVGFISNINFGVAKINNTQVIYLINGLMEK